MLAKVSKVHGTKPAQLSKPLNGFFDTARVNFGLKWFSFKASTHDRWSQERENIGSSGESAKGINSHFVSQIENPNPINPQHRHPIRTNKENGF